MTRLPIAAVLAALCLATPASADDTMTYDPEPDEASAQTSSNARALELYDKKQYEAASILLIRSAAADPSSHQRQEAEFLLGKTLYHMGYRAGALVYFSRIARAGAGHRYRIATLRWLAALAKDLPESAGAVDAIGQYTADELADPAVADVADALAFWAARSEYRAGDLSAAASHLERVAADSELHTRARLLEGATRVRLGQLDDAVTLFRSVADSVSDDEQRDAARLQLARTLYSTASYDDAIAEYDRIEPSSGSWPTALFESAWAHLLAGDRAAKTLGNLFSLSTPYLEDTNVPEARWLEAIVYHSHCQYDRALTAVRNYERELLPMREELAALHRRLDDAAVAYAEIAAASTDPALSKDSRRLLVRVLDDPTVRRARALTEQLETEIELIEAADPSWNTTSIAAELMSELSVSRSFADVEAGRAALESLRSVRLELRELSRNGKKLRIDALDSQEKDVHRRARGKKPSPKNRRSRIPEDEEHYRWGSNGEIWRDEVGSYYKPITDRCPKK